MNNKSIGYWDGYLSKEAEDSTGGWEESLAELNKVEGLNAAQAAARREELQKQLEDDFFYGVTAEESKRKFGAAGAGAGLGAVLGGLMGGTRGAAVGGILGSLLGFVGQAMGLIPEDTWEWLMKWRKEGKVGGEVKKLWGKREARLAAEAAEGTPPVTPEGTPEAPLVNPPSGGQGDPNRRWGNNTTIQTIIKGDNGNAATNGINANVRAADAAGTSGEKQAQADLQQATDVANKAGVGEVVKTHAANLTLSNQKVTGTQQGTHTMPGGTKGTEVAATTPEPAVSPDKRVRFKYDPQQGFLDSKLTREDLRGIAKNKGVDAARASAMSNVAYWNRVANENEITGGAINPGQTLVPRSVVDNPIGGMPPELRGKLKARYTWQQMNLPLKGLAAPGTPEREEYNTGLQKKLDQHWTSGAVKPWKTPEPPAPEGQKWVENPWGRMLHPTGPELKPGDEQPAAQLSQHERGVRQARASGKGDRHPRYRGFGMSGPAGDAHVPPKKNKNTRGLQSGFSGGGALWNSNKLGAAEVLSMPWYAAQKQADPAQIQQDPAQVQQAPAQIQQAPAQIQQAPTEKQQFEYKAKMDQGDLGIREMDKKKEVIEMEMRAGQLKAEQKERESSKSMAGMGQSTVGMNPSTVGTNPSTVGMDQSTVGTEQSTVGTEQSTTGTEPTAMAGSMSMNQTMPEAQWTAPTA